MKSKLSLTLPAAMLMALSASASAAITLDSNAVTWSDRDQFDGGGQHYTYRNIFFSQGFGSFSDPTTTYGSTRTYLTSGVDGTANVIASMPTFFELGGSLDVTTIAHADSLTDVDYTTRATGAVSQTFDLDTDTMLVATITSPSSTVSGRGHYTGGIDIDGTFFTSDVSILLTAGFHSIDARVLGSGDAGQFGHDSVGSGGFGYNFQLGQPVPEPASLFAVGVAAVLFRRRRRA